MSEPNIYFETIQGDGVELRVTRCGKGPAIILLHGFPENWTSWRHQIPALANAGFSVWAPDLRGYNGSEKPKGRRTYHLRHLVEDVAALVRASGESKAHIVGHDWGGVIAWTFAGIHPEMVDTLTILNAPHMQLYMRQVWRPPQLFKSWYVLLFQLPWLPELLLLFGDFALIRFMFRHYPARQGAFSEQEIEGYVRGLELPGALTAAINYYRANMRPDGIQLAMRARSQAPTLIIWGESDPALSIRVLDGIEEVAPSVTVKRITDAGHWIQNEAPEEVNNALMEFLKRNSHPH